MMGAQLHGMSALGQVFSGLFGSGGGALLVVGGFLLAMLIMRKALAGILSTLESLLAALAELVFKATVTIIVIGAVFVAYVYTTISG